jgi:hypothetical protein
MPGDRGKISNGSTSACVFVVVVVGGVLGRLDRRESLLVSIGSFSLLNEEVPLGVAVSGACGEAEESIMVFYPRTTINKEIAFVGHNGRAYVSSENRSCIFRRES